MGRAGVAETEFQLGDSCPCEAKLGRTFDGTARGGILVAAAEKFGLPIYAIGVGETADDLRPFDPRAVARAIAGLPPE